MEAVAPTMPPAGVQASQYDIQEWLRGVDRQQGFPAAIEALFQWCLKAGYFPDGIFEKNLVLEFPDTDTPVVFRTQINYSRQAYKQSAPGARTGCQICMDQVASPAKPLLRVYEFRLGAEQPEDYFIQLTPFPLRPRHYILIQSEHSPMRVSHRSIDEMLDLVTRLPHFTACSNSDVRDAGVSIIDHHHYQVFADYKLPVMQALAADGLMAELPAGRVEMLDYPLTTVRVRGSRVFALEKGAAVVHGWKQMAPGRNTCNLTVNRAGDDYEIYLFLRNPTYLTPHDLLRIKSEAVGVVEASGEAIYPPPSEEVLAEVRRDGLSIFKRILSGLNPVVVDERPDLFLRIRQWVGAA